MPVQERFNTLRTAMSTRGLDAMIILTADAHLSEYVAAPWQHRAWLTGFDGSAGDVLVTADRAWLTVDSRYHAQADQQVNAEVITVVKLGLPAVKPAKAASMTRLLADLPVDTRVGYDPRQVGIRQFRQWQKDAPHLEWMPASEVLADVRETLNETIPLFPADWKALDISVAGESLIQKLTAVRASLSEKGATVLPLIKLDEIAWLFNLRGGDIPNSPMGFAYALISPEAAWLFTHENTLPESAQASLRQDGVTVLSLDRFWDVLAASVNAQAVFWLDEGNLSQAVSVAIKSKSPEKSSPKTVTGLNPVAKRKAVKNPIEINGMREAVRRASVAVIRTLAWVSRQSPLATSESDVAAHLFDCYRDDAALSGLSFPSIVGAGANSAIVHYSSPSASVTLSAGEFLLIDSGGQYLSETPLPFMGTTDATRTVLIGSQSLDATPKQKHAYTAVLKSLIAVTAQPFPAGTTGAQLDGIARSPLWHAGLDFGHGTGHGVGAYLSVHEGPNGIHKRADTPLESGMITSIEPGFYESGWGGIRLENLAEVVPDEDRPGWLRFQTLTWLPFDPALIDGSALTLSEKAWLAAYGQGIRASVLADLSPEDAAWLETQLNACTPSHPSV